MNRREALRTVGTGAAFGLMTAGTIGGGFALASDISPLSTLQPCGDAGAVSPALAAAIEEHRASIRKDETLYGADCEPIVDTDTIAASDAVIGTAFLALMAVPCLTTADAAAKAAHVLGGSVGLREHGWQEEFLNLLIPDNEPMFDPAGPLVTFLHSLTNITGRA